MILKPPLRILKALLAPSLTVLTLAMASCSAAPSPAAAFAANSGTPDPLATLGRTLFFDPALSASGSLSCASCHDPHNAYAPPANSPNPVPGPSGKAVFRTVPSLSYILGRTPNWHQEHAAVLVERLEDRDTPPFGGFAWDGRFKTLGEQAAFPLLSPEEMANPNAQAILTRLKQSPYAARLQQLLGPEALADSAHALHSVGRALERFEFTDPTFHPYSSKYDAVLNHHATLTQAEQRGLTLFNDPARGNCNSCHTSAPGADGSHPLFTNFQFEALGVPRNPSLAANRHPAFYDLGLCGPLRADQSNNPEYCGLFKTPTLRNVATRSAFFHNGRFKTLREALEFYVQRDTNPEKYYPRANGKLQKFNDVPARYRANMDTVDNPLTKHPGEAPAWNAQDVDDILAFLQTLTDGYTRTPSVQ